MQTAKADVMRALTGLYETIRSLAQQLTSVVGHEDFETEYVGRRHEIRRIQAFFSVIRANKKEEVRESHIAQRNGIAIDRPLMSLIYRVRRDTRSDHVAGKVRDCVWVDEQLFGGGGRPAAWKAVMDTVRKLGRDEEAFFQLVQQKQTGVAWEKIHTEDDNEDWQEYDFVKDPKLLEPLDSLLRQLKLLG
jgi:hypothetical protein